MLMRVKALLLGFLVVGLFSFPAMAWEPAKQADALLTRYIEDIKLKKTPFYMSECELAYDMKGVVVLKVGSSVGNFFVITNKKSGIAVAPFFGQVGFSNGGAQINWQHNDTDTKPYVEHMALYITLMLPFRFVAPEQADQIFTSKAQVSCSQSSSARPRSGNHA